MDLPSSASPFAPSDRSRWSDAWRLALIALGYAFSVKLSLFFPDAEKVLASVWPPSGVALAALLLSPRRKWPAILAVIFVTGLAVDVLSARSALGSFGFMVANILEPWGCAWLITRRGGDRPVMFTRVSEVLKLTAAATAVNSVTAIIGAAAAQLVFHAPFHEFYLTWWIADGLGIVMVTPLVVACAQPWRRISGHWLRQWELVALGVVSCTCAWLGFLGTQTHWPFVPQPYWMIVPVMWSALRFSPRATTILLTLVAVIALGVTASGQGRFPLGGNDPIERLQMVQLCVGVITVSGLVLAASVTQRKKTETALRAETARRDALFEQSPDGILIIEPSTGRFVEFNTAAHQQLGYSREEFARLGIRDVECMETAEATKTRIADVVRLGRADFETRHRNRQGEVRQVHVTAQIVAAQGQSFYQCIWRDITDRRRAEWAAQESDRRYRWIADHTSDVIWILNLETMRFSYVSPSVYRLRGYTAEEVMAEDATRAMTPESLERVQRLMPVRLEAFRRGVSEPYVDEIVQPCKNGTLIETEVVTRYVTDEATGQLIVLGVSRDISERKRAEAALRDREERYRMLFETESDAIFVVDFDTGRFVEANAAAMKLYGYSREEILGMQTTDISTEPEKTDKAIAMQQTAVLLRWHRRKDGSVFPVEIAGGYFTSGDRHLHVAAVRDITERHRTMEALRRSQAFLSHVIDDSPNSMWISDERGTLLRMNQSCRDSLHLRDEEVVGKYNIFKDNVVEAAGFMPLVQTVFDEGVSARFVISYDTSAIRSLALEQSAQLVLDVHISPIVDEDGKVTNAIVQHVDISEHKRAEAALQASEARFRAILEHSRDAIGVHLNGTWVLCNPAAVRLFGVAAASDLLGSPILNVIAPAERSRIRDFVHSRTEDAFAPLAYVTRGLRADGTEFDMDVTLSRFPLEGKPHVFVILRDITERKRAEAALRDSEEKFRQLANNITDVFWITSPDFKVMHYVSPGYELVWGRSVASLYAHPHEWADAIPPEDRARILAELAGLFDHEPAVTVEYRIIRPDGSVRWIADRAFQVRDEAGKVIRLTGIARDITERIAQEHKLQLLLTQTEVDARTKGDLLREVNHRVTNNLTAVLGLMAFEHDHASGDPQAMASILERLSQRIRGLLHVHRMLSRSEWAPVPVNDLAGQIIRAALGATPGRQSAVLTIQPGKIKVSPRQAGTLAMVFNELVTNTVKYAVQSADTVAISFGAELEADRILLRYRDNGPGYPPEVVAGRQSNVGLKLIHELVTKTLGGSVVLSNERGAVTTLHIALEEETRT